MAVESGVHFVHSLVPPLHVSCDVGSVSALHAAAVTVSNTSSVRRMQRMQLSVLRVALRYESRNC